MKCRYLLFVLAINAVLGVQQAETAEIAYPTKPIRVILGFSPGGVTDIIARLLGQKLVDVWEQPVVVDNRPGAGSTIAAEIVANSAPDGYTLVVVSTSHATSAGLYKINYDPINSFTPITLIASNALVLLAHPSVPARSAKELIALAKANPSKVTMGSAGTGSITHLAGVLFENMADIKITNVPYKGGAPNLIALLSGEIQITVASIPAALSHLKAGRVKALGLTSVNRSTLLPNVPTIAESGLPGYEAKNWTGMLAPAGVPSPVIAKLNGQVNELLRTSSLIEAISKHGADAGGSTPEAFRKYLRTEIVKWSKVTKAAGLP